MEKCGIYLLRNSANGKVYVGQSVHIKIRSYEHRKSARRGDKSHLYDAMRRYGVNSFACEVLEECPPERFDERETFWMAEYDCLNPDKGYNFMPAGQRGRVMDAAMRARLSELSRGYKHTPEAIEKIRASSTGKTHSAETKAKMSRANTGRVVSKESAQRIADGLKLRWLAMSQQEKDDYAVKRSGWSQTDALKQAVSERFKGKPKTAEQRANMSAGAKARTPESDARRLAALHVANKNRWDKYRLEKQESVCCPA